MLPREKRRVQTFVEEQKDGSGSLLRHNLKTVRAYLLKEAFEQLGNTTHPPASKFTDEWRRQTGRSRISHEEAYSLPPPTRRVMFNYFGPHKLFSSGRHKGPEEQAN
jgi:hypothetical protein